MELRLRAPGNSKCARGRFGNGRESGTAFGWSKLVVSRHTFATPICALGFRSRKFSSSCRNLLASTAHIEPMHSPARRLNRNEHFRAFERRSAADADWARPLMNSSLNCGTSGRDAAKLSGGRADARAHNASAGSGNPIVRHGPGRGAAPVNRLAIATPFWSGPIGADRDQAADLTVCRAWWSSNCLGLR